MVWVGSQCGIVVDALPGTLYGQTSPCDYCSDDCEQVACSASEYESAEEMPEVEDWDQVILPSEWNEVGIDEGVELTTPSGDIFRVSR